MTEREKLEGAIAAQESMRATLGDAIVDISLAALREKLAALDQTDSSEQRKLVTILFADVSGFTAMSESMDAEEVRDTMNSLWSKLDAAILCHGGRVDKHIGDALMAIFGVPAAKEDDPERAVRAALELQKELEAFAKSAGRELKMRVGVNTGTALLGAVGSNSEFTAMGDAVNLASRLEHAAPIGGVLISHDLYLHVRGIFDVEPQEPIQVKGKKDPVQTYIVKRAKPRSFRLGTRGLDIETKMVGRDAELKQLQDGFEAAFDDREAQMTTVVGDAGMGKSRLTYEFTQWIELHPRHFWYFAGRASPETANSPYGLLKDLFCQRFEIGDGDSTAAVHAKFERGVAEFLKDDSRAIEKSHYIGRLLGFDFSASPHVSALSSNPALVRERGVESVLELFRAAEKINPILLLFEDVHWADDASLDFISNLMSREKGLRLFVLALARPTLFERRPSWGEGLAAHRRINLTLLSKRDSRRLVEDILSRVEALPESLREMVVGGSEGNPFYVEELIRMLMEEGVVDRSGEKWLVNAARLAEAKVPPTLVGVLQARLDSLQPAEKTALQCASVIGRIFWDSGLAKLSPAGTAGGEILDKLRVKDMVFRREGSAFSGANEYIFKHALLRDVAYESVLKRQRKDYHALAAAWLAAQCGERAGEFSAQLARHYELAGDNAKAAELLGRAADDSLSRGNAGEAAELSRKALALEPGETARRADLLKRAARILRENTEFDEARKDAAESMRLFRAAGDRRGLAEAMNESCLVLSIQGDFSAHAARAEEFRALAEALGDPKIRGDALSQAGAAAFNARDYPRAKEMHELSLAIRSQLGADLDVATSHSNLGVVEGRLENHASSKIRYEAAIEHYRAAGDALGMYRNYNNLGQALAFLGERQKARELLDASAKFSRDHGLKRNLAIVLDSIAEICELEDDLAGAKVNYLEAIALKLEVQAVVTLLTSVAGYARVLSRSGHAAAAVAPVVCVLAHPSANGEGVNRANEARALIEKELGAKSVEAAIAAGPPAEIFPLAAALVRDGA
jgi:class 3 adenylate cyclase